MRARKGAGKRLERAREQAGLRLDDASVRLRDLVGPVLGVSRETIRRYEADLVPEEKWDPVVILALADIYGVPIAQLSPVALDALARLNELSASHLAELGDVTRRMLEYALDQPEQLELSAA